VAFEAMTRKQVQCPRVVLRERGSLATRADEKGDQSEQSHPTEREEKRLSPGPALVDTERIALVPTFSRRLAFVTLPGKPRLLECAHLVRAIETDDALVPPEFEGAREISHLLGDAERRFRTGPEIRWRGVVADPSG
jgi:hypothetical protein